MGLIDIPECQWDSKRWIEAGDGGAPFILPGDMWRDFPVCSYDPPEGFSPVNHNISPFPPAIQQTRVWVRVEGEVRSVSVSVDGYQIQEWSGERRVQGPCGTGSGRIETISGEHVRELVRNEISPHEHVWNPQTISDTRTTTFGDCTDGSDYYDDTSIQETDWPSGLLEPMPEAWGEENSSPLSRLAEGSSGPTHYRSEKKSTLRVRVRGTPGALYRVFIPLCRYVDSALQLLDPLILQVEVGADRWGDAEPVIFEVPETPSMIDFAPGVALDSQGWIAFNCGAEDCESHCLDFESQGFESYEECVAQCLFEQSQCQDYFITMRSPLVALRRLR